MAESITILDIHMMAEICSNLYDVRGGSKESGEAFGLSMSIMEAMLVVYGRNLKESEIPSETT